MLLTILNCTMESGYATTSCAAGSALFMEYVLFITASSFGASGFPCCYEAWSDLKNGDLGLCTTSSLSYAEEVAHAGRTGKVPPNSAIAPLQPMLRGGILCVDERIGNAEMPDDAKAPIILRRHGPVIDLLVRHEHQRTAGREHVLDSLRRCYWIIGARTTVRRLLKGCVHWWRRFAKPEIPRMADLPEERRKAGEPPFTSVGVDYFGPFMCNGAGAKRSATDA